MSEAERPLQAVEVEVSRRKLGRDLLVVVMFLAGYTWLLLAGKRALGAAGIVVFGVVAAIGLWCLLPSQRLLARADEDGVALKGWPVLPWENLAALRLTPARPRVLFWAGGESMRVLAFVPTDPEEYLTAVSPLRRRRGRLTTRLYGGPLTLLERTIPMTLEELCRGLRPWTDAPIHQQQQANK